MTESGYVLVSDLTKVRNAIQILRDVIVEDNNFDLALRNLARVEQRLSSEVGDLDE